MDTSWRSTLSQDCRQKIVSKIMDTLQRHMPLSGPDGTNEVKKIAVRFEEKIFAAASGQHDYLKKISLKMRNLETLPQNPSAPGPTSSNITSQSSSQPLDTYGRPFSIIHPLPVMDTSWRSTFSQDSRQKIVSKIMDTLQRHMPLSGPDGTNEVKNVASRFEEKIFVAANDQHDYLKKISLKMLNLETLPQNPSAPGPTSSNITSQSSSQPLDTYASIEREIPQ